MDKPDDLMEKLVSLCKRRGFIFQSSEIYGGLNGCWDYGPLGVELKRNVKNLWWADSVTSRDDMVGLDASVIMNPRVWEASGHVGGFADPMVDCRKCKGRFRADQVVVIACSIGNNVITYIAIEAASADSPEAVAFVKALNDDPSCSKQERRRGKEMRKRIRLAVINNPAVREIIRQFGEEFVSDFERRLHADPRGDLTQISDTTEVLCPRCRTFSLTPSRSFNLMFTTHVGAVEDQASLAYLRPETAQGIFCNFKNILDTQRLKLPFGIAQIGKAFRNEINPRNYTFRSREFEQMEIEFFCQPDQADDWYQYWRKARFEWYINLGLSSQRLRLRDHDKDELAHYAASCADVEYDFPFGVSELEGIANRTNFDLKQHQESSGKDLTYFDDQTKERFLPYVIEPSAGVDRSVLAFLCEAYTEDEAPDDKGNPQRRVLMKLHPKLAPIKAAVFPLVKKDTMPQVAHSIYDDLKKRWNVFYDEKGAVGRRYRRQDEAGTPFCITIDGQTLQDQTVTIRDRDSLNQDRVAIDKIVSYLSEHLGT